MARVGDSDEARLVRVLPSLLICLFVFVWLSVFVFVCFCLHWLEVLYSMKVGLVGGTCGQGWGQ